MRARRGVGFLMVLAAVALLVLPTTSAAAAGSGTTVTSPDYVARAGTQLTEGGAPWKFAGYNLPCRQPFLLTSTQLGYYFDDIRINSGANVVRMWWFQSDLGTGANKWAPFDSIVATAKAHGIQIVPALANQWNTCDEPTPAHGEKTLDWYQHGYSEPEGGYALSYRAFVQEITAHFANQPTIAFWQLMNEAEDPAISASGTLSCDPAVSMDALRSFSDAMATVVHKADPHHLVNLGTQGTGQCGTAGSAYQYVHAGKLDLCEFHDYGDPTVALSTGPNSLRSAISACHADGKPIFVGESGIDANVQPNGSSGSAPITEATFEQRAAFFKARIDAGKAAGLVGYVIWFKSPFYTPQENSLDIADGDPTESVLADARAVSSAANLPEFPWPAAALAGTGVVGLVFWLWIRRTALHVS